MQSGRDFYDLRKASGIVVLADCVRDANAAMDALMIYNDRALDWGKPGYGRTTIASKASTYGTVLDRCDGIAGETIRQMLRNSAVLSTAPKRVSS